MKKLVFAVQVFSLIIMLPMYIILELNHKTPGAFSSKTNTIIRENAVSPDIHSSESAETESVLFGLRSKMTLQP